MGTLSVGGGGFIGIAFETTMAHMLPLQSTFQSRPSH